jgi:uncharacterized protein YutE (UPF0331/DUF86 family)
MPVFDQDVVTRLISVLRKSLDRLRVLSQLDESAFVKDADKVGSAKYHFIVAIESCIDLCNHIIARNGYRAPEDYGDTFRVMADAGGLSPTFADDLVAMAKFRNRLVHLYWEVDDRQVHEFLRNRLDDMNRFLGAIAAFLNLTNLPP